MLQTETLTSHEMQSAEGPTSDLWPLTSHRVRGTAAVTDADSWSSIIKRLFNYGADPLISIRLSAPNEGDILS